MTCYYPLVAEQITRSGKTKMKIMREAKSIEYWKNDNYFLLPCGKCIGCKLDIARQWACRCVHEAQMHEHNCFITLTYNDKNIPKNMSLNKRHLQLFFKRFRQRFYKENIKYYACGEYGDESNRPHYHACIFGFDFLDKKVFYSEDGYDVFISNMLNKLWKKGNCTLSDLTLKSAGYVARYCTKKITGDKAAEHYGDRQPEFALMSRGNSKTGKNGIGIEWIKKYLYDVYPKDFFTIDGCRNKPPRYYDDYLKASHPDMYELVKERRRLGQLESSETSKRLIGKDKYKRLITKTLIREL